MLIYELCLTLFLETIAFITNKLVKIYNLYFFYEFKTPSKMWGSIMVEIFLYLSIYCYIGYA